ncbi:DUF1150 family protein [Cypionkella sp. TWP1-2-1b2]|uniref:DUF1150 family protein n=1 Tax=Cypionkella sp. TWP1-2-1b2 TaxID=2804675 RepID=UPI003CEE9D26
MMDVKFDGLDAAENRIVYVRPIAVESLPEKVRAQINGMKTVYAVHGEDGEQLALVADRDLAFSLARQHDMAPVNAH